MSGTAYTEARYSRDCYRRVERSGKWPTTITGGGIEPRFRGDDLLT